MPQQTTEDPAIDAASQPLDPAAYQDFIRELIDLGAGLAKQAHAQVKAGAGGAAARIDATSPSIIDYSNAFLHASRAVRGAITLAHSLGRSDFVPAAPRHRIIREAEVAIGRAKAARAAARHGEARGRFGGPSLDREIATARRPVPDVIADLCRDLGLAASLPGTRSWQLGASSDIAALCARAAAPPATVHQLPVPGQIPPMKLARAGVDNEDLFTIIAENVRNPRQVVGDIQAFMAANRIGSQRLLAFMDEYGLADLRALAAIVQDRAETAMRAAIRALPDGVYTSAVSFSPVSEALTIPLRLTVDGDAIELDFTGAPPQLAQGGVNSTMNYTAAHATYPLKCMLTPQVRGNAGCYRPFTVRAPEGSILNCTRPAAVAARVRTGWYLAPAVFQALSGAAPQAVQSPTGLPVAVMVSGRLADGTLYADHLFMGGGQGGSSRGDGKSGLLYPTSAANTAIEVFEARVPVLVTEKVFLTDSGGAGTARGGLGQRVRFRKLHEDGLPTLAALFPEGARAVLPGLAGGQAGGRAFAGVRAAHGTLLHDCGAGELVTLTRTDEVAEIVFAGGAGYGDPQQRHRAAVAEDLLDGRISGAAARETYGAALPEAAE